MQHRKGVRKANYYVVIHIICYTLKTMLGQLLTLRWAKIEQGRRENVRHILN